MRTETLNRAAAGKVDTEGWKSVEFEVLFS